MKDNLHAYHGKLGLLVTLWFSYREVFGREHGWWMRWASCWLKVNYGHLFIALRFRLRGDDIVSRLCVTVRSWCWFVWSSSKFSQWLYSTRRLLKVIWLSREVMWQIRWLIMCEIMWFLGGLRSCAVTCYITCESCDMLVIEDWSAS